MEDDRILHANKILFCDTNLHVIKVWSEFKYGNTDPEILKILAERKYDLYLLTNIDIPWVPDPQREHPDQREQLYNIYRNAMRQQSIPFVEIRGEREQRRKDAVTAIQKMIFN
jgi:nicotinamide riboside kinase